MRINICNVRSFFGEHSIPIKPLTFLVGDNSSGKTTLLAVVNALKDLDPSSFNKNPYELGGFQSIASYKKGKAGRAKDFSIGYELPDGKKEPIRVFSSYISQKGQIVVKSIEISSKYGSLVANIGLSEAKGELKIKGENTKFYKTSFNVNIPANARRSAEMIFPMILSALSMRIGGSEEIDNKMVQYVYNLSNYPFDRLRDSLSYSPVRSKPKRIYGVLSTDYNPEGDHAVAMLIDIINKAKEDDRFVSIKQAIETFGDVSGLYSKVNIKVLGREEGSPYQVRVGDTGRFFPLVDVGYGVSQVLPIIIQCTLLQKGQMILLQQPEVHLHPRAQAELGTFFSYLVGKGKRQAIIETHSDYILDRTRQEIVEGTILAREVSILFFNKEGAESRVYPIEISKKGELIDPPEMYRDFFIREQINLLKR